MIYMLGIANLICIPKPSPVEKILCLEHVVLCWKHTPHSHYTNPHIDNAHCDKAAR